MQFTIAREAILPAIQSAHAAIGKKGLPILQHLLLCLEDGSLSITGTDLETQVISRCSVDDPLPIEGSISIASARLNDIVRLSPENSLITVKDDKTQVLVTHGRSRYKVASLPSESFPAFSLEDETASLKLPAATLLEAISKVAFAMGSNDVRHFLNGLHLAISEDGKYLTTAASNGHILASYQTALHWEDPSQVATIPNGRIFPRKAISELTAILKKGIAAAPNRIIDLEIGDKSASISMGSKSTTFSTKFINGRYPDFKKLLCSPHETTVTLPSADLIAAVDRVMVVSASNSQPIKLKISAEHFELSTINSESESAMESIDIIGFEGKGLIISFSGSYLKDALGQINSKETTLYLSESVLHLTDPNCDGWKAIVMPMRT